MLDGYFAMSGMKIDPAKRQISGWVNNQRFASRARSATDYGNGAKSRHDEADAQQNATDEVNRVEDDQRGAGLVGVVQCKFKTYNFVLAMVTKSKEHCLVSV